MVGAHRAAGEGEAEESDRAVLPVADVAPGAGTLARVQGGREFGQRWQPVAERERRGQFERAGLPRAAGRPQFGDPDRAVAGRAADGAAPGGEQRARRARQGVLGVAAVQEPRGAEQFVAHPGLRVGGAQPADDGFRRVAPVDAAYVLAHRRPGTPGLPRGRKGVLRLRPVGAGREACDGRQDRLDRRVRDLVAVEVALAHLGDGAVGRGPDVSGIHLVIGLQHRHAPTALPQVDRPVHRGGAAVADRARVHDQAGVGAPDLARERRS